MLHDLRDIVNGILKDNDLSQEDLAKKLKVSREVLNRFLNGSGDFPKKAAKNLNELYQIPFDVIYGDPNKSQKGHSESDEKVTTVSKDADPDLHKTLADLLAITKEQVEVTRIQAETADKHAQARVAEADNIRRLIGMLERKQGIIAGVDQQTIQAVAASLEATREVVFEVAAGKRYHSEEEVRAVYHRRITDPVHLGSDE